MLLVSELASTRKELENVDRAISDIVRTVTALDVINDPALKLNKASETKEPQSEEDLENLTVYQLNAKLQETEAAAAQLNEFWVIKNLILEAEQSVDALSYSDVALSKDGLLGSVEHLKKLREKVLRVSDAKLAISASLKRKYETLLAEFRSGLSRTFGRFASGDSQSLTIHERLATEDGTLAFDDFISVASTFEALHPVDRVTDELSQLRAVWDKDILEPAISKSGKLTLSTGEDGSCNLVVSRVDPVGDFSMDAFLQSLQHFVHFVNATNLQATKNYFSSKLSNGLADVISENIQFFTEDDGTLTQKLLETLEMFSSSGWSVPLRNIFTSRNDVQGTLKELHLNWITDKYIDELRAIFSGSSFDEDIQNQTVITKTVEIQAPVVREEPKPIEPHVASPKFQPEDNVSEEIAWDENWGSDEDEESAQAPANADGWNDTWSDSWDEDEEDREISPAPKTAPTPAPKTAPKAPEPEPTPAVTPQIETKTYTLVLSAIPEKVTNILAAFDAETEGADPRVLLDTIFALALISYPPIALLFLLLNDMGSVECRSPYLRESAESEWKHFCQSFSGDATKILQLLALLNSGGESDGLDGGADTISSINGLIEGLADSPLRNTNSYELETYILQVLNLVNTIALQQMLKCEEITEYQSEEFTRFLEGLQIIEDDILARFGKDASVLATSNKVMQTKFLINNHLKSIMEYFYQGELYDFSTQELVSVIKSVFIPSELRENCLQEIIDVRQS